MRGMPPPTRWGRLLVAPWPGCRRHRMAPRYVLMRLSTTGSIYRLYIGALVYLSRMAAQRRLHGRVWIELNMEPAYNPLRGRHRGYRYHKVKVA